MKENEKIIHKTWDSVKAVLRGRLIAMQAYFKKTREKSNK